MPRPTIEQVHRLNRPVARRMRLVLNALLLGLVLVTALLWVRANFEVYNEPGNLLDPFTDANTYLAAGERLNAGHDLYRLGPGDRPVLIWEGLYASPLLSPPPIAVLWRPLAALPEPLGMSIWLVGVWVVLLGTVVYLVMTRGLPAVLVAFALSMSIGEQLAVGNAQAFFPAMYLLLWRYRDRAWPGALVGLMAAIKLAPIAMVAWLLGLRNYRAVGIAMATLVTLGIVGAIGAGPGSYLEWLSTVGTSRPTPLSISGITGQPLATYVVLAGGAALAFVLAGRPAIGFVLALGASVLGTPALYVAALVPLLAVCGPMDRLGTPFYAPRRREAAQRVDPALTTSTAR